MGRAGSYSVQVYDLAGRRVRVLNGDASAGEVVVPFDGRDSGGQELASGTYLYRVQANGVLYKGRMSLVR
jgi:flagellar hook assembly protein FlgD